MSTLDTSIIVFVSAFFMYVNVPDPALPHILAGREKYNVLTLYVVSSIIFRNAEDDDGSHVV